MVLQIHYWDSIWIFCLTCWKSEKTQIHRLHERIKSWFQLAASTLIWGENFTSMFCKLAFAHSYKLYAVVICFSGCNCRLARAAILFSVPPTVNTITRSFSVGGNNKMAFSWNPEIVIVVVQIDEVFKIFELLPSEK